MIGSTASRFGRSSKYFAQAKTNNHLTQRRCTAAYQGGMAAVAREMITITKTIQTQNIMTNETTSQQEEKRGFTNQEIQAIEANRHDLSSWNVIHLLRDGNYWHANEWSAWLMSVVIAQRLLLQGACLWR